MEREPLNGSNSSMTNVVNKMEEGSSVCVVQTEPTNHLKLLKEKAWWWTIVTWRIL